MRRFQRLWWYCRNCNQGERRSPCIAQWCVLASNNIIFQPPIVRTPLSCAPPRRASVLVCTRTPPVSEAAQKLQKTRLCYCARPMRLTTVGAFTCQSSPSQVHITARPSSPPCQPRPSQFRKRNWPLTLPGTIGALSRSVLERSSWNSCHNCTHAHASLALSLAQLHVCVECQAPAWHPQPGVRPWAIFALPNPPSLVV